jgi:hypothetical protein
VIFDTGPVMPWFIDVVAGAFLALGLYALVRFRMIAAPRMNERYGSWARWATWLLVAILMVVVANLELIALREILHGLFDFDSSLAHEIVFSLVALIGGYLLVAGYVRRDKKSGSKDSDSDCRIKK